MRVITEEWITAYGFPSYEISTHGRIRNKYTKRILKQFADRYGYLRVSLGNADNVYIHRLACMSFYGPPENEQMQVNHIDGDRQNNHVLNLEWCTPRENIKWGIHNGNIDPSIGLAKAVEVNRKPVKIVELNETFDCVKDCAEFLGVPPTNVSRCLVGSRKGQRIHGYHIEFV